MSEERETFESVRETALEALQDALEYRRDTDGVTREDWDAEVGIYHGDIVSEVADDCVPIYNYDRFAVLADSRVWSQDVSEHTPNDADMVTMAGIAIYLALEAELYEQLDTIASQVFGDE